MGEAVPRAGFMQSVGDRDIRGRKVSNDFDSLTVVFGEIKIKRQHQLN